MILEDNCDCSQVYLVNEGGVAACETSCFREPILIYSKGAIINLYQVLMNQRLHFTFIATSSDCYRVRTNLISADHYVKYD